VALAIASLLSLVGLRAGLPAADGPPHPTSQPDATTVAGRSPAALGRPAGESRPGARRADGATQRPPAHLGGAGRGLGADAPSPLPPLGADLTDGRASGPGEDPEWSNDQPLGETVGLDPHDLAFLAELAALNDLSEESAPDDHDDGNGVLEPWEVGTQRWRGGRLVELTMGPDRYSSFGYGLHTLPPDLGTLAALETLDLQGNRLTEIPESIGDLPRLQRLRLQRNALREVPASIGRLRALEELALGENRLRALPAAFPELRGLRELHVNDNPLARLPDAFGALTALRVLNLSHAVGPGRAGTRGDATGAPGLERLPAGFDRLDRLETVLLAGNRLFCVGGAVDASAAPRNLRDGVAAGVHGLPLQRCTDAGR